MQAEQPAEGSGSPVAGAPSAGTAAPAWERFLDHAFRGDRETIRFARQLWGVVLVGLTLEQMLMVIYGSGGTGKSTMARVIMGVLGDYATMVTSTVLLKKTGSVHPEMMMPLKGRRLGVISEMPPYFLDLDAPTLPAYEVEIEGIRVWRVWCKHCRRWHEHGAGEGHRIAHCEDQNSAYRLDRYNLSLAGTWLQRPAPEGASCD